MATTASWAAASAATLPTYGWADNITSSIIAPHEYDLPLGYQPYWVTIQYGFVNHASLAFNNNGGIASGSKQNLFVGDTKIIRFVRIPELPQIGLSPYVIIPEMALSGSNLMPNLGQSTNATGVAGLGDVQVGFLLWCKPTTNTTLGMQEQFSGPSGTGGFSTHNWTNYVGPVFDVELDHFNLTTAVGAVTRTTEYAPGNQPVAIGSAIFANGRFGFKNSSKFEPFFGVDWQIQGAATNRVTHATITQRTEDLAMDVGVQIKLPDKLNLTVFYNRSVAGRSIDFTNAVQFKLVKTF